MPKPLSSLFTELRVADVKYHLDESGERAELYLESMECEDTLYIRVDVPRECLGDYDLGDYKPGS